MTVDVESESESESSEESSGPGGLAGLIASLSGGDMGSDVGALLGKNFVSPFHLKFKTKQFKRCINNKQPCRCSFWRSNKHFWCK